MNAVSPAQRGHSARLACHVRPVGGAGGTATARFKSASGRRGTYAFSVLKGILATGWLGPR